jgi:hypothetical protein
MTDLVVAVGLVLALEGLMFAAFPDFVKRAMAAALETPDSTLRAVGIASAVLGVLVIWMARG